MDIREQIENLKNQISELEIIRNRLLTLKRDMQNQKTSGRNSVVLGMSMLAAKQPAGIVYAHKGFKDQRKSYSSIEEIDKDIKTCEEKMDKLRNELGQLREKRRKSQVPSIFTIDGDKLYISTDPEKRDLLSFIKAKREMIAKRLETVQNEGTYGEVMSLKYKVIDGLEKLGMPKMGSDRERKISTSLCSITGDQRNMVMNVEGYLVPKYDFYEDAVKSAIEKIDECEANIEYQKNRVSKYKPTLKERIFKKLLKEKISIIKGSSIQMINTEEMYLRQYRRILNELIEHNETFIKPFYESDIVADVKEVHRLSSSEYVASLLEEKEKLEEMLENGTCLSKKWQDKSVESKLANLFPFNIQEYVNENNEVIYMRTLIETIESMDELDSEIKKEILNLFPEYTLDKHIGPKLI